MQCGTDYNLFDLLSAAIKQHNTLAGIPDNWAWGISLKTKADMPAECSGKMTLEEKLKSTVSIEECRAGNIVVVNVVLEDCSCLTCGEELPCITSDMKFEDKLEQTLVYTTDGEWAFHLLDISAEAPQ
jgi:hypothetical protein